MAKVLHQGNQVQLHVENDIDQVWSIKSGPKQGQITLQSPGCTAAVTDVQTMLEFSKALLDVYYVALELVNAHWAEERAGELMELKFTEVPALAYKYLQHLAGSNGITSEICFTAYCHYIQYTEKLDVHDGGYRLDKAGLDWFHRMVVLKEEG